ncbi:hypothetical protein DWZ56_12975 [Lachnotalea sp. AF33-28]|nr:hypothetical protein DWZ56_12975 [Lachnotalea sp. AF33-28]
MDFRFTAAVNFSKLFSCGKVPAQERAGYGPHRDALSLREARSGSNAANYAAKEPAGFKGSL